MDYPSPTPMNPSEKRILYCVITITVVAVVLAFWQFGRNVNYPFEATRLALLGSQTTAEVLDGLSALGNADSDGDGLTDLEEISLYKTSPYLEDSDSDGIADNVEVAKGTDPICPEGQDCYGTDITNPNATTETDTTSLIDSSLTTTTPVADPDLLATLEGLSIEEVRALLVKSGVPSDTLNALSDDEVRTLLRKSLTGQTAATPATKTSTTAQQQQLRDWISGLSGDEVKQFLVQYGFDAALIEQNDPEQLKQLLLDTLGQ